MNSNIDRKLLSMWYKGHKNEVDRIINDLRKQSYELTMHIYDYTATLLGLEFVVSQADFPNIFSNYYTRVGSNIGTIISQLIHESNFISILKPETLKMTVKYWLVCGDMYEVLADKLKSKFNETESSLEKKAYQTLIQHLIESSIKNGIKTETDWNFLSLGKSDTISVVIGVTSQPAYDTAEAPTSLPNEANSANHNNLARQELGSEPKGDENKKSEESLPDDDISEDNDSAAAIQIPDVLNTEQGMRVLQKAIRNKLCDENYLWKKDKALLAYFSEAASDYLQLSNAELKSGKMTTNWEPFATLFKEKKSTLVSCKSKYRGGERKLPNEHETVDAIFIELKHEDLNCQQSENTIYN